jgi:hypothetical protein
MAARASRSLSSAAAMAAVYSAKSPVDYASTELIELAQHTAALDPFVFPGAAGFCYTARPYQASVLL